MRQDCRSSARLSGNDGYSLRWTSAAIGVRQAHVRSARCWRGRHRCFAPANFAPHDPAIQSWRRNRTAAIEIKWEIVMLTNQNPDTVFVTDPGLRRRWFPGIIGGMAECNATRRTEAVVAPQKLAVHTETASKNAIGRTSALFAIALASAVTATACSPIPCPSGYADPNWCTRNYGGGGGPG
jgi:hypothetical protein